MTKRDAEELGRRMTRAREAVGLSSTQVAASVGVSERTVQKWEDGSIDIRFSRLLAFARVVGIPVESLARRGRAAS